MLDRRSVRGARKPVVVDLLVSVVVASFVMAGFKSILAIAPGEFGRTAAGLALLMLPVLAGLYGAASAIEMRRGWVGSSAMTGLLHAFLVVGSVAGIGLLAVVSPMAAGMAMAAEGLLLLWSSSWL
ncbi:hypothetical protein [Tautonia plasticadhaerens]|uniref:Major facilitator superfamily (MFS) profile domain-containing protein n=1 Tax=Tautonia plasticadhaerens TaxID=2527974 RepID=A0A518H7Q6_9BACT|nr:hypothetical protein [Tautonia plasticadhaerens]QDV36806.1 hypothetical protein ElP_47350 [Tautonia plasticadhaerens]